MAVCTRCLGEKTFQPAGQEEIYRCPDCLGSGEVNHVFHYYAIDEAGFGHGPACGAEESDNDWVPKGMIVDRKEGVICWQCRQADKRGVRVATIP